VEIQTHQQTDADLCGRPIEVAEGWARVEFSALSTMAVDNRGLTHGGFVFGLADYAAMLAVNHPNVVLGGAKVTFLKPVKTGDSLEAEGIVQAPIEGKKRMVSVVVRRAGETVFKGDFACFVLEQHVLSG
jgi:acyl-coenzyme A thioesterase PaaI-like protein